MEQQQVEPADAETLELLLGCFFEVVGIGPGATKCGRCEPRKSTRSIPFGVVKIMADRTDQPIVIPGNAGDRPADSVGRLPDEL